MNKISQKLKLSIIQAKFMCRSETYTVSPLMNISGLSLIKFFCTHMRRSLIVNWGKSTQNQFMLNPHNYKTVHKNQKHDRICILREMRVIPSRIHIGSPFVLLLVFQHWCCESSQNYTEAPVPLCIQALQNLFRVMTGLFMAKPPGKSIAGQGR